MKLTIGGTTKRSKFSREVEIDWDALPEASRDRIVAYGLKQFISDGVAFGKDENPTEADFNEGIDERLRKLREADFSRARGEKEPVDNVETLAKRLCRESVKAAIKASKVSVPKDEVDKLVEGLWAIQADEFTKEAQRQIEGRAKLSALVGKIAKAEAEDLTA